MRGWLIPLRILIYSSPLFSTTAIAQSAQVPSASQQIAAAVLPLPEVMREHATVLGHASGVSLVTHRQGSNGMVCTASRPSDAEIDVRGYQQSFMPIVRRMGQLRSKRPEAGCNPPTRWLAQFGSAKHSYCVFGEARGNGLCFEVRDAIET